MIIRNEERRRHKRINATIRIRMSESSEEIVHVNGITRNLSLGGACIELGEKVPVFTVCKLFLGNPGCEACELDGRILWIKEAPVQDEKSPPSYLIGIQFLSFNSEEKRKFILELMGNNA